MLKDTLNKLFQQMEVLYPNARRFLPPGLSAEEIARLEEENSITLSQPVKDLYTVINGPNYSAPYANDAPFAFPAYEEYQMLSLEEAFEHRWDCLRGQFFDEYEGNWLPLFVDNYEYWLFVDLSSEGGAIIEYIAEFWEGYERRTVFPSLDAMFVYVSALFINGCYSLDADGELQKDDDRALKTALAMFDLPYWKEREVQAAEYEQTKMRIEEAGLAALALRDKARAEGRW